MAPAVSPPAFNSRPRLYWASAFIRIQLYRGPELIECAIVVSLPPQNDAQHEVRGRQP